VNNSLQLTMRPSLLAVAVALSMSAHAALAQTTTIGAALTTSVGPLTRNSAGFQTVGQSFVVPSLTPRLSSFSLTFSNFNEGGTLRFDAYLYAFDAANRRIAGSALWQALNSAGSANDFGFDTRLFNLGNLTLSPSATYMFLVTTSNLGTTIPEDAANLLGGNDTNGYAGGALWTASSGIDVSLLFNTGAFSAVDGVTDANFSAVFTAAATVVPEPATVWLTGSGLALLALAAVRRRGQA